MLRQPQDNRFRGLYVFGVMEMYRYGFQIRLPTYLLQRHRFLYWIMEVLNEQYTMLRNRCGQLLR